MDLSRSLACCLLWQHEGCSMCALYWDQWHRQFYSINWEVLITEYLLAQNL